MVSRALRVALAGGMVAGAFAVAQPAKSDAAPTVIGACSGTRAIASAKSTYIWPGDGKNAGVTDIDNKDVTISAKGTHSTGGVVGTVGGQCGFLQAIAADKGLTTLPAGTRTITKWGSKTVSPEVDCLTDVPTDTTEWPLSGKLSYTFSDLTKTDAYVTTATPSGGPADVVVLTGVITKGVGIGARIDSAVGYTPIVKDKLQTNDWDGVGGSALGSGDAIQGYATDLGNAVGCQDLVPANANLRTIMLTTEAATPLLGSAVPAGQIYIGA